MKTYVDCKKEIFFPLPSLMWSLDLSNFEKMSLPKRIGVYCTLYYYMLFLRQNASSEFELKFKALLEERTFRDEPKDRWLYMFDLKEHELMNLDDRINYLDTMEFVEEKNGSLVFMLDYDEEKLLYIDLREPWVDELYYSRRRWLGISHKDFIKSLKKYPSVESPLSYLRRFIPMAALTPLNDWYRAELRPVYEFLMDNNHPLDLSSKSFLKDRYFLFQNGKFYTYLLSNSFEGSGCGEVGEGDACRVDLSSDIEKMGLNQMLHNISGIYFMLEGHLLSSEVFYDEEYLEKFKQLNETIDIQSRFHINSFFYGQKEGLIRFEQGHCILQQGSKLTITYGDNNIAVLNTENICADEREENENMEDSRVSRESYTEEWYIEWGQRKQWTEEARQHLQDIKTKCKAIGLPLKLGAKFNDFRLGKHRSV